MGHNQAQPGYSLAQAYKMRAQPGPITYHYRSVGPFPSLIRTANATVAAALIATDIVATAFATAMVGTAIAITTSGTVGAERQWAKACGSFGTFSIRRE